MDFSLVDLVDLMGCVCKQPNNIDDGEQKLHQRGKKDFGQLTVQQSETEGDMTRGACNLLHYFTIRKENAPPLCL